MINDKFYLVGYESGIAGVDVATSEGPLKVQQSVFMQALKQKVNVEWVAMLKSAPQVQDMQAVGNVAAELAKVVSALVKQDKNFCVIGGDHSAALGTWSGVYDAMHMQGDIGLIWIDAHMDSHTPETSETQRIHGMPLACLLGYGATNLVNILNTSPKIKPENLCLIGIRSFESGEAALLKRLNVKVYFMEEVEQRGFVAVLEEAVQHIRSQTVAYGVSFDLDSIDPADAPAVDVPEAHGIPAREFLQGIDAILHDPKFIAAEIVEFNPNRDKNQLTEKLIFSFLNRLARKNNDKK